MGEFSRLWRGLLGAMRNGGVDDSLFIEPQRVEREETRPTDVGGFFLVINHPKLLIGPFHDAMMAGTDDFPAAVRDGVARIFHERTERRFRRGVTDGVIH